MNPLDAAYKVAHDYPGGTKPLALDAIAGNGNGKA